MTHSNAYGANQHGTYTVAEVDAMIAFVGRRVSELRAGLDESDALAEAGERIGYESAYHVLRRAVVQMLLATTGDRVHRARTGTDVP